MHKVIAVWATLILLSPGLAYAHPGHHNDLWLAELLHPDHLIVMAAFGAIVVLLLALIGQRIRVWQKPQNKTQRDDISS